MMVEPKAEEVVSVDNKNAEDQSGKVDDPDQVHAEPTAAPAEEKGAPDAQRETEDEEVQAAAPADEKVAPDVQKEEDQAIQEPSALASKVAPSAEPVQEKKKEQAEPEEDKVTAQSEEEPQSAAASSGVSSQTHLFQRFGVFENQRYLPLKGWRSSNLLLADPTKYSNSEGKIKQKDNKKMPEPPLPQGWSWHPDKEKGEWSPDLTYTNVGKDGWTYGTDFPQLARHKQGKNNTSAGALHYVRRRRFVRTAVRCKVEAQAAESIALRAKADADMREAEAQARRAAGVKSLVDLKQRSVEELRAWHRRMTAFFTEQRQPFDSTVLQAEKAVQEGKSMLDDVLQFFAQKIETDQAYAKSLCAFKLMGKPVRTLAEPEPSPSPLSLTAALRSVGRMELETASRMMHACQSLKSRRDELLKFKSEYNSQTKKLVEQLLAAKRATDTHTATANRKLAEHTSVFVDMREGRKGAKSKDLWHTDQQYRECVVAMRQAHAQYVTVARTLTQQLGGLEEQRVTRITSSLDELVREQDKMWGSAAGVAQGTLKAVVAVNPAEDVRLARLKREGAGAPGADGTQPAALAEGSNQPPSPKRKAETAPNPGPLPKCSLFVRTALLEKQVSTLGFKRWTPAYIVCTRDKFLYCFDGTPVKEAKEHNAAGTLSVDAAQWKVDLTNVSAKKAASAKTDMLVYYSAPGLLGRSWSVAFRCADEKAREDWLTLLNFQK